MQQDPPVVGTHFASEDVSHHNRAQLANYSPFLSSFRWNQSFFLQHKQARSQLGTPGGGEEFSESSPIFLNYAQ